MPFQQNLSSGEIQQAVFPTPMPEWLSAAGDSHAVCLMISILKQSLAFPGSSGSQSSLITSTTFPKLTCFYMFSTQSLF